MVSKLVAERCRLVAATWVVVAEVSKDVARGFHDTSRRVALGIDG